MTKKLFRPVVALTLSALLFAACGKDKNPTNVTPDPKPEPEPTVKEKIIGSWNLNSFADDYDRNGKIEEAEKYPPDNNETYTLIFDENDKYTIEYEDTQDPRFNYTETQKWILTNDDKEIMLIYSDTTGSDTSFAIIQTLTEKDMVLYPKEDPFSDWIFLTKK